MRTSVFLSLPSHWPAEIDVLSVDLDTRAAPAADAQQLLAAAGLAAHARLFLKIDSTLRGPVAALVEAALDSSGLPQAIVAPAFHDQGRVYEHGILVSHGVSLYEVLGTVAQRCRIVDDPTTVSLDEDALLVGSAGLARHLAGPATVTPPRATSGPVLVVAGSTAVATRTQVGHLPSTVTVLDTPPGGIPALARAAAQQPPPGLVILTGGATARAVCTALGVDGIDLLSEVLPGIPIGRLRGGIWPGILVVTKAGGFGGPNTLLDVLRLVGPSSVDTP
jgi:D-threonate/D-erythronate kinase